MRPPLSIRDPLRLPREGTRLRRLFDTLCDGEPVCVRHLIGDKHGYAIRQLRDFYNCEVLRVGTSGVRLLGRWDGPTFIPVERLPSPIQSEAA